MILPFPEDNLIALCATIIALTTIIAVISSRLDPPTPQDTAIEAQYDELPGAPYNPPVEFYLVLAVVAFIVASITIWYTGRP